MSDIPEWAMAETEVIYAEIDRLRPSALRYFIARALVRAKEQGIVEGRERLIQEDLMRGSK